MLLSFLYQPTYSSHFQKLFFFRFLSVRPLIQICFFPRNQLITDYVSFWPRIQSESRCGVPRDLPLAGVIIVFIQKWVTAANHSREDVMLCVSEVILSSRTSLFYRANSLVQIVVCILTLIFSFRVSSKAPWPNKILIIRHSKCFTDATCSMTQLVNFSSWASSTQIFIRWHSESYRWVETRALGGAND